MYTLISSALYVLRSIERTYSSWLKPARSCILSNQLFRVSRVMNGTCHTFKSAPAQKHASTSLARTVTLVDSALRAASSCS